MSDLCKTELPGLQLIQPNWPAPGNVRAFTTTRNGGFSQGRWRSLNLSDRCDDKPEHVKKNRELLRTLLPCEPHWLRQVHGKSVSKFAEGSSPESGADAIVSGKERQACAILTADCLPVLFCNKSGTKVAAAHAGWRGLAAGVLEATVLAMESPPSELMTWLGPAIGPRAFEVGDDVYESFVNLDSENSIAFESHGDRWLSDLYRLAKMSLNRMGIRLVSGGQYCTYSESDRFFSYRRDGVTGRMATVVWMESQDFQS